jgi:3-hydroxybutyrate dehydrogenase
MAPGGSPDDTPKPRSANPKGYRALRDAPAALVTGAASGIGLATAQRLRADGFDVLGFDREDGDLTTREGNATAVRSALDRFGRLDVVVANAGFQHVSPVQDFPEDRWDALLAILLTSPFLLAKYAWDALTGAEHGRFIVVASAHALVASPYKAAYVAAKHGVLGLVKTLALEGLQATAVCPGYVRTPLVEAQIPDQAKAHGVSEQEALQDVILAPHAVKRLIEPEEVANVIAFLSGPGGAAFSGAPVTMDLGWSAR